MYIEQLYTKCLAEAAYYIESDGEAAVIDPLRDTEHYTRIANQRGAQIKYIFESHFHADFVSGHIDLANETGAKVVFGPGAEADYDIYVGVDQEEFILGKLKIRLLHTPGHTLESSCFLLLDENDNPHSIFTGDTLFVGEVGRPDLAVKQDLTKEQLAGMLYDSLASKIKTLPSYVIVYPGHGPGSACGKSIGKETHSTIGIQKEFNYALNTKNKSDFINNVTDGLTDPPSYFYMDAAINRKGYKPFQEVLKGINVSLSIEEVEELLGPATTLIDSRSAIEFSDGFIPGSINIGIDGNFAVTVGSIIDPEQLLVLICENGREEEALIRLARVGYENVAGFLNGSFKSWIDAGKKFNTLKNISASRFAEIFNSNSSIILDVRNPDEWVSGIVAGAVLLPLPKLAAEHKLLDKQKTCYIYCAGGYRSMAAASILMREDFQDVINIVGGMQEIKQTAISINRHSVVSN